MHRRVILLYYIYMGSSSFIISPGGTGVLFVNAIWYCSEGRGSSLVCVLVLLRDWIDVQSYCGCFALVSFILIV